MTTMTTTTMAMTGQAAGGAFAVEAVGLSKRFGSLVALDDVSLRVAPGEVHALLGENGAGKSTLVKCMVGYYRPDQGSIVVAGRERPIANPRDAYALGIGMVYQHFTLVPSMTVAENLVMSRADVPAVIDWRRERRVLDAFLATTPFKVPLDTQVSALSAGERQKTEILKQLYLDRRFLILDEPTSVLTPGEAVEMLTLLRGMARAGRLSILLITHKFREVTGYTDRVTVLRRGRLAGSGASAELTRADLAAMMIGRGELPESAARAGRAEAGAPILRIAALKAVDDSGRRQIMIDALAVHRREIVGVAGVSGNGQKELVEVLGGQRGALAGSVEVNAKPYRATRAEARAAGVRCLPEEPLRNACAARMSVAENLAFRNFDAGASQGTAVMLDRGRIAAQARDLIATYGIKTASKDAAVETLSGGNVQRVVLARELSGEVNLLIAANPCFGLDIAAVAEIRGQLMAARNRGAAVLLVSEDLDELLELSDRILVMSEGRIVYETPIETADVRTIGAHMAGHH
jgi:general nucleoside transport system ATP-binding protein